MFREDRPLSSWLPFGLHFGIVLGAKFATVLHFRGCRVHFGDPRGKKIHHRLQKDKKTVPVVNSRQASLRPLRSKGGTWAVWGLSGGLGGCFGENIKNNTNNNDNKTHRCCVCLSEKYAFRPKTFKMILGKAPQTYSRCGVWNSGVRLVLDLMY